MARLIVPGMVVTSAQTGVTSYVVDATAWSVALLGLEGSGAERRFGCRPDAITQWATVVALDAFVVHDYTLAFQPTPPYLVLSLSKGRELLSYACARTLHLWAKDTLLRALQHVGAEHRRSWRVRLLAEALLQHVALDASEADAMATRLQEADARRAAKGLGCCGARGGGGSGGYRGRGCACGHSLGPDARSRP